MGSRNETTAPATDELAGYPPAGSVPVSVLVPVKNEAQNLHECLRRCAWATQVVVVDSQSSDGTAAIATADGAEVYQFTYDRATGWPKKKNWALRHIAWRNGWVLIVDADEHVTPALAAEVARVVAGVWAPVGPRAMAGTGDAYWINRRFMFMGKWMYGCGYYPSWNVRLLKHGSGCYERFGELGDTGSGDTEVHEHITLDAGRPGYLSGELLHYAYPDLSTFVEKHNRYSTWEAHTLAAGALGTMRGRLLGSPVERRRWLKNVARHLPLRPSLRFLYSYIVQRGFVDGYEGFVLCRLIAWYEFLSIAKRREMDRHR